MDRYVVAVLVNNQFGVLNRVASMFRRRGFNIDTLTVGETQNPSLSRITITFRGADSKDQIIKQLEKMPDVYDVQELSKSASVSRELLLIKINNSPETRQDIMSIVDVFRAKVIDYAPDSLTIEVTGESSKVNAIVELLKEFGIIEMCRTGVVALTRGKEDILATDVEVHSVV
ncbi:MAG: acetolactate synthase small subunit [Lachnospiraceae bacterium]|nr:acetolactate synthase small subunit [Lachnospiraceae bacterium]